MTMVDMKISGFGPSLALPCSARRPRLRCRETSDWVGLLLLLFPLSPWGFVRAAAASCDVVARRRFQRGGFRWPVGRGRGPLPLCGCAV